MPPALLTARGLSVSFGGVVALHGVDLEIREGSICGLIGPNGAGKSTLFNCISGHYRPHAGTVHLGGADLSHCPPHARVRLGLARTFQHPLLLDDRRVLDNVLVGGHVRSGERSRRGLRGRRRGRERRLRDEAREMLAVLGVAEVADQFPDTVGHGVRKHVELARALLSSPRVVLLDEPAAGLSADEVDALATGLLRLRADRGLTVVLVEHDLRLVAAVSDRVVALVDGRVVASGSVDEVRCDPRLQAAYLGV